MVDFHRPGHIYAPHGKQFYQLGTGGDTERAWNVFMDPHRLAKTTLIQQSIISILFGKSLICHNNGGVKLVKTWCDVQSIL